MGDYVSGSGAQLLGATYIPPDETNNIDLSMKLDKIRKDEQDKLDEENKAKENQKWLYSQYFSNKLDPANFDLGNADLNSYVTPKLQDAKLKLSQAIQKGIKGPDLNMMADSLLHPVTQLYSKGKQIKDNITSQIEDYKNKNINTNALRSGALHNALHTRDSNGNDILLDPNEIDPDKPYVANEINSRPHLYYTGYGNNIGKNIHALGGDTNTFIDKVGRGLNTKEQKVTIKHVPGLTVPVKNADTGKYEIQTRSEDDPIFGKLIPSDMMGSLVADKGDEIGLRVQARNWLKNQGVDPDSIPANSPTIDKAMRKVAYDEANKFAGIPSYENVDVTKPPRISVNVNTGEGSKRVNDVIPPFTRFQENIAAPAEPVPGLVQPGIIQFRNGKWLTENGQPYTGKINLSSEQIPASLSHSVRSFDPEDGVNGMYLSTNEKGQKAINAGKIPLQIESGDAVGIRTNKGYTFTPSDAGVGDATFINKSLRVKEKINPLGSNLHAIPRPKKQIGKFD